MRRAPARFLCPSGAGSKNEPAFHGLRSARLSPGCAPPVAASLRPAGAKTRPVEDSGCEPRKKCRRDALDTRTQPAAHRVPLGHVRRVLVALHLPHLLRGRRRVHGRLPRLEGLRGHQVPLAPMIFRLGALASADTLPLSYACRYTCRLQRRRPNITSSTKGDSHGRLPPRPGCVEPGPFQAPIGIAKSSREAGDVHRSAAPIMGHAAVPGWAGFPILRCRKVDRTTNAISRWVGWMTHPTHGHRSHSQ